MKIIDDLLKASNGYICGVETSKEYKALVKRLEAGDKAIRYLYDMERSQRRKEISPVTLPEYVQWEGELHVLCMYGGHLAEGRIKK